ncbi:MAG: hypothetical protein QM426_04050 [Euryarchaeota archaeon]|nr:hypothetical protein [Euryarchaeota archaeon]
MKVPESTFMPNMKKGKMSKNIPEIYKNGNFRSVSVCRKFTGNFLLLKNHLVLATANAFVTFFEHLWQTAECSTFSFPVVQS